MIPEPVDQVATARGEAHAVADPSASTPHDCKTRNVIERTFNKLKNWRGLTTRYDKHPVVDGGGARRGPTCI